MWDMTDEVIHSESLVMYLVVTTICNDVVCITTIHSIGRYSAGFGGKNTLHGQTLGLLGETVGNQLPMLVKFMEDPAEDLAYGFALENVLVPSDPEVIAYFALPTAGGLLPGLMVAQEGVDMNLSNLCPIPIAWAPYFINFKAPFEALQMGKALLATLETVTQWMRAMPLLD